MKKVFEAFDTVVLRTPMLPYAKRLDFAFDDAIFEEALYVASPELYEQKKAQGNAPTRHMKQTLYKYWTRAATRATPFGLFSSWSVGKTGCNGDGMCLERVIRREVRLDMTLLCAIVRKLVQCQEIAEKLVFYPNDSAIVLGNQMHYVSYEVVEGKRSYSLQSVTYSRELKAILTTAKGRGICKTEAVQLLCGLGVDEVSASLFVESLIESQLLVSEIEVDVTDGKPYERIFSILQARGVNQVLLDRLDWLDCHNIRSIVGDSHAITQYKELCLLTRKEVGKVSRNCIVQVDAIRKADLCMLPDSIAKEVCEVATFLARTCQIPMHRRMEQFQAKFYARYEERRVPLLLALDSEWGIGYPVDSSCCIPEALTSGLERLGETRIHEAQIILSPFDVHILRQSAKKGIYATEEVSVTDYVQPEENFVKERLPHTISAMFRLVEVDGVIKVDLVACGGVTAASLLGRVACLDSGIGKLYEEVCKYEQKREGEDTLIAEIVHVPQDRQGNVICRPVCRKGEIHYMSPRKVGNKFSVNVSDLMLDMSGGTLQLTLSGTRQRVLPILSNAHNYTNMPLPAYYFLGDYQYFRFQTIGSVDVTNLLGLYQYAPRIMYGNVMLSPRKWLVKLSEFCTSRENCAPNEESIKKWRIQRCIPEEVYVVDDDNELYVNFSNSLATEVFSSCICQHKQLVLCEAYGTPSLVFADGKAYRSEIILSLRSV